MSKTNNFKKLTLCALVATACGVAQTAYAHTGVKDTVTEGKGLYTAFTLGHGCQDTPEQNQEALEKLLPVTAQSVVFPNGTASQAFKINADKTETAIDLSDYISGADGGVITLAPGMIQDKNVFKKQKEVTDAQGAVRGIQFTNGNLDTTAVGLIPFKVSAPSFTTTVPDGNGGTVPNCAKSLKIRIAIANYCKKTNNENQDNRSDIWIGHLTPKFKDPGVMPHDWETSPFWPTLTVNRTSALDASCGAGFDIAVQPSDAEVDTYLPVKGYWPK